MEVEILAARFNEESGRYEVAKRVTNDEGVQRMELQIFAPETLEWRAGEYGIDPTDIDTLIDIVLYENHTEVPRPLWNAPDRATARAQLLSGIQNTKASVKRRSVAAPTKANRRNALSSAGVDQVYVDAAEEDPVEVIKRTCRIDPEVVAVIREHVDRMRKKSPQGSSSRTGADRAAELRKNLMPRRPSNG